MRVFCFHSLRGHGRFGLGRRIVRRNVRSDFFRRSAGRNGAWNFVSGEGFAGQNYGNIRLRGTGFFGVFVASRRGVFRRGQFAAVAAVASASTAASEASSASTAAEITPVAVMFEAAAITAARFLARGGLRGRSSPSVARLRFLDFAVAVLAF